MHALGPQSHIQTSGLPVDRYPGVQPFGDTREDRLRFFGRDEETSVLLHQLLGVDMLVLFGKPGLGKTSLLRARLFPRRRERDFLPVPVRFNHADPALTPMQVFTAAIEETCAAEAIDYTAGDPKSLWALFKTAIFWRGDRLQIPVLILDQFEEISLCSVTSSATRPRPNWGNSSGVGCPSISASNSRRGSRFPSATDRRRSKSCSVSAKMS